MRTLLDGNLQFVPASRLTVMTNDAAILRSNPQLAKIQMVPAIGAQTTRAILVCANPLTTRVGRNSTAEVEANR